MANVKFGGVEVELTAGTPAGTPRTQTQPARPVEARAFRILVLGDFSGRGSRGEVDTGSLAQRKPRLIDPDTFNQVLRELHVTVHCGSDDAQSGDAAEVVLQVRELEDFHPDRLMAQLPQFETLRSLRRQLQNPDTFAAAAARLLPATEESTPKKPEPKKPEPEKPEPEKPEPEKPEPERSYPAGGDLLAASLEATEEQAERSPSPGGSLVERLIQQVIAPHVIPAKDPREAELVASVDAGIAAEMRRVLHHPHVQATEAAWRGLDFLLRRIETGSELKLYLLDVSREELAADLGSGGDLDRSGLYRVLVERTREMAGGEPWSLLVVNETWGATAEEIDLLGRLAEVARAAAAPMVAAASTALLGCSSLAATPDPRDWQPVAEDLQSAWQSFREQPASSFAQLVLPRFLLRLPYGTRTNPIESFAFEEVDGKWQHENYLWGSSGWLVAVALATSFLRHSWQFNPGAACEIGGLPVHIRREDGETTQQPCGEAWLTERAAQAIARQGLRAVISVQHADRVVLASG